jgi:oxaloacetate decarboxylase alpha subunit
MPISDEIKRQIIGNEEAITCRPADLLEPGLDQLRKETMRWAQQDEDVLSYALFPQVAKEFFEYREAQQSKVDPKQAGIAHKVYPV